MPTTVSIVIPVYRSEASLETLVRRILDVFTDRPDRPEIVLIDDVSPDSSWDILKALKAAHPDELKIARLLRNSGQHNAILCGFSLTTGDIVVTMDDDLQNPPEEIPKLIVAIESGYDLAIGAYDSKKHHRARNVSGGIIDRVQRSIFHLPSNFQLTSFRAAKRVVVEHVCQMGGAFPYVTSMLLANASSYTNVAVRHDARPFGRSTYNLRRSLSLASNLIFNYSNYPVYAVGVACVAAMLFSVVYGLFVLVRASSQGTGIPGWASTIVILTFFNSVVLLCNLIFSIYLARMSQQVTRSRIQYAIREIHE